MHLQNLLLLSTLAQLPALTQAFLLHPHYRKNRTAHLTRCLLAPLGLALLTWFTIEWRASPEKTGPMTMFIGCGVTVTALRSLIMACAKEPYYRLPSKKHSEASRVPDKTGSLAERLQHAHLILMRFVSPFSPFPR